MQILVVTGLSGAGKSTVLHALEDLGAYCVDNIPVPLVLELVRLRRDREEGRILAIGIDARDVDSVRRYADVHRRLCDDGHAVEVVFVEASRDVLVRRYSETRRRHPMGELPEAIDHERTVLASIRELAERPMDTSNGTGRQLRQLVRDRFGSRGTLRLVLMSFGFRNGLPTEADTVLDSRFLDNPHEREELRPLSGLHEPVARYVLEQPDAERLLESAEGLLRFVVPRALREGRSYFTVAIGCTGGQHRSVALVEALKSRLGTAPLCEPPPRVVVRHRDVGGDGGSGR